MGELGSTVANTTTPQPTLATGMNAAMLVEVSQLFNSRLQIDEIIALLAKQVAERLQGDCIFYLVDGAPSQSITTAWHAGHPMRAALLDRALDGRALPPPESLVLGAARRGEAVFAPDLDCLAGEGDDLWRRLEATSLLSVPIRSGNELLGMIVALRGDTQPPFGEQDMTLLQVLTPQAAGAIITARVLAEERWQRQKAELMFQASKAVHTELHFDQAVREIALLLKQAIKTPWVGIFEYQPQEQALVLLASTSEPAIDLRLASQRLPIAGWPEVESALAESEGEPTIPLPAKLADAVGHPGARAWALPLVNKHLPQGLLLMLAPNAETPFPAEAREVSVGIAELVALAIANQHLVDQEAKARIQIIRSQAAAQEREVLLRQIVHDLRNATQAMSLVVEDMEFTIGDNPQVRSNLATLESQITFVSNFLKEKLSYFQHGDRINAQHATALTDVFADLDGRFGPAAKAKHQRLIVSSPEPIKLPLSAVQIEQIIGNLLDNAIKYTQEHGEIRLWADHSDGWVTLYVADNGPGIPTVDQARLGEVGYRGQQAQEGHGLGLSNVRQLVTRAGGLFGFSSHLAVGTTFHVSLPTTTWGRQIS
jgi:signal transduction histidine kinase